MRTFKVSLIFSVIFFIFLGVSSNAADVAKIGVVDFQKILGTSVAGKHAKTEIQKQGKKMEADLKGKYEEIDGIKKKIEHDAVVMSKEMREEKERDLRIKINDLKTLQKRYENEFRDVEKNFVTRIKKEVFDIVQKIGKEEGYLLIIDSAGVIYLPNTVDVTDKVIQKYNTVFAEKMESKTTVEGKE